MKKINTLISKTNQDLKKTFIEEISNKEFKKYVYDLNIKEDILIKYTSLLKDAFLEQSNCNNCRGLSSCKNKIKGYRYSPELDGEIINFSYQACSKNIRMMEKNEYLDLIELYDMPKEVKEASFNNIYKDDKKRLPILKYFKEFIDDYKKGNNPKGMYLSGSFGSGKTYLISALFNEMAKKGINSVIVYYPEFLRSLKASFSTNYDEKFMKIKKVPLLLIDDIGAENSTAWARDEVLAPILQYRMEEKLPTFFTSNLTIDELENHLSEANNKVDKIKARRIIERVKQLTIKEELISENRRK